MSFKPDGYNSVSPYLVVDDAQHTLEFAKEVLAAVILAKIADENGRVMHCEFRIDDTVVMLGESAENWPAIVAHLHVYVPDVDAVYERAIKFGAESIQAPVQKDDADKRCGVKDANGIHWWLTTRIQP